MTAQAFPLSWPDGWPRTPARDRTRSKFKVTADQARRNLQHQLEMLGATPWAIVISSNVELRRDGQPYAGAAQRALSDPGVAVYFDLAGDPFVMARDAYLTPHENMHSIGHAIEHMRGLERHGGDTMMKRAFSGFAALPPPISERTWWDVLECGRDASIETIRAQHRRLASIHHPDRGGDAKRMAEINAAREKALAERAVT